jgi:hypothetical protein
MGRIGSTCLKVLRPVRSWRQLSLQLRTGRKTFNNNEPCIEIKHVIVLTNLSLNVRGRIQKFPDWAGNEINNNDNNKTLVEKQHKGL